MHRSMKFGIAAIVLLAAPAAGQVPTYTNADLGKPLRHSHTITPEEYRGIVARRFIYVPPTPVEWLHGPRVTIVPYTPPAPPQFFGGYWEAPYFVNPYVGPSWFGGPWGYGRGGFQEHVPPRFDRPAPPRDPIIDRPASAPRGTAAVPPPAPHAPVVRGNGIIRRR
jgi:hypothetical protein